MKLRASQIEVLKAFQNPSCTLPADVAVSLDISDRAAKGRLDRLTEEGLLEDRNEGYGIGWTYRLTPQGRKALRKDDLSAGRLDLVDCLRASLTKGREALEGGGARG